MVWLHGGNFSFGGGSQTDGSSLARRGIVVVTLNYRLGPLGFLAHPALSRESKHGVSGNYGLLDQIAALQWVRANIAAFGGDPGKVTLMGQSAGATSVLDLMASPLAHGLFHQVIAESGGGSFGSQTSLASEEQQGAALGFDIATLRVMPAEEIVARFPQASAVQREGHFYPNMDGYVVPSNVLAAISSAQSQIPMIVGSNSDEALFWSRDLPTSLAGYSAYVREWFAADDVDQVAARYPATTDDRVPAIAARLVTDFKIAAPTLELARSRSKRAPVYLYRFSRASPGARSAFGGAAHNTEIAYVFGQVTVTTGQYEARDQSLSEEMANAWAQFIKTGNPNGPGLAQWPAFKASDEQLIEFGDATTTTAPDGATAAFFKAHPPQPEK